MDIPVDFNELARMAVKFRTPPSPDTELIERGEMEVRRYACIWGFAETPESLQRISSEGQDAGIAPSLRLLESLEIDSVMYLTWHLSVPDAFVVNDKVTCYSDDYLVLTRMDEAVCYCTGFYLKHPLLREVQALRPEHFAWLDHQRYLTREAILDIYRKRIDERPRQSSAYYELALLVWTFWSMTQPNLSYVATQILPGQLEDAVAPLTRAVELAPRNSKYHGLLGEVLMTLMRYDESLLAYRHARDLDSENPRWAFLIADTYLVMGDEIAWRRQLGRANKLARAKGGRTDERNARMHYQESLERSAEKLRSKVENLVYPTFQDLAEQDRASISIRPDQVPPELRDLIPLAEKWGIGDDGSRSHFVESADPEERAELTRALDGRWEQIEAWLDSFAEGEMSDEAGCFMYMLEAAAEMA